MFKSVLTFLQASRHDLLVLLTALFNRNTPKVIKIMTMVAFVYLISPIDFLPDVIPGIGLFDDAVIVPGILYTMLQLLPASVRARSESQVDYLSPKMPWILGLCGIFLIAWTIFVFVAIYNFIFN